MSKFSVVDENLSILDGPFSYLNEVVKREYTVRKKTGKLDTSVVELVNNRNFKEAFDKAVVQLRLPRRAVPHQLRHAGPSFDFATKQLPLADIKLRGRWEADSTVRRYQKAGRIDEQVNDLDTLVLAFCKKSSEVMRATLLNNCKPLPPP